MNKNLKIGLSLLIIASVFFFSSTVAFIILRESEKQKRLHLEQKLQQAVRANESIAKDLENIKVINQDLETKLDSAREEAKTIAKELAEEKEAKRVVISQMEQAKSRADELMADIMKEKEERLSIVQQLSKAEEAYHKLKEQFELMLEAKETLEDKLKGMMARRGVELEKIEVKTGYSPEELERGAEGPVATLPAAEGRGGPVIKEHGEEFRAAPPVSKAGKSANVLVVNRKFDFIVTDLGKSDGIGAGSLLDIYRDGEFVARTRTEKLYDNMSAAIILPEWKGAVVREGDDVRIYK